LISMVSSGGGEIIRETFKTLTSTAYGRSLEKEADIVAVDYLIEAKIDPQPFADFMYQMGLDRPSDKGYSSWVSTHPASTERAEYIIEYSKDKWDAADEEAVLQRATWDALQENISNL
jgi:predicted Zn-dependent protease